MKHAAWFLMVALLLTSAARAQSAVAYNAEVMAVIEDQEKKVVSLAEAVPQEKYTWSPGAGVRSTAEIYLHIALANYLFAKFLGVEPPADFVPKGFDKSTTDKATARRGEQRIPSGWLISPAEETYRCPLFRRAHDTA